MHTAPPVPAWSRDQQLTFNVLVLYEDFTSGVRGKQIADIVVAELDDESQSSISLWNIELLQQPYLGRIEIDQSGGTDLLIVSLGNGDDFSIPLRSFINRWLEQHANTNAALVATFREPGATTDFARHHLESAARRARVEFFTPSAELECDAGDGIPAQLFRVL